MGQFNQSKYCAILAMTESGLVGKKNGLPWKCSLDMGIFQRITMGHPVVMGRATTMGMKNFPLPGRKCGIISESAFHGRVSHGSFFVDDNGVNNFHTIGMAMHHYDQINETTFVAGGRHIFDQVFRDARLDTVVLTTFPDGFCDGDVYLDPATVDIINGPDFIAVESARYTLSDNKLSYYLNGDANMREWPILHRLKPGDTPFPTIDCKILRHKHFGLAM
ncbi:MAG: dihydrofolate reductase [Rickettsiales bacterium]|nr:dihydrofolate reductase [Rickettsiales bacterium]